MPAAIGGNSDGMNSSSDDAIEDDVGDLVGLGGDQPAPDRVALRPDVLALVVEALRVLVDDDAEHDAVEAGDDAAVEFRRAGVDRDRMALRRIADRPARRWSSSSLSTVPRL